MQPLSESGYCTLSKIPKHDVSARWWKTLTPRLIVMKVKPWSLYSYAHCTVSMFRAALETLYDGTVIIKSRADISMDSTVVDLMSKV